MMVLLFARGMVAVATDEQSDQGWHVLERPIENERLVADHAGHARNAGHASHAEHAGHAVDADRQHSRPEKEQRSGRNRGRH